MAEMKQVPVTITTDSEPPSSTKGSVEIIFWSSAECTRRGVKFMLLAWALAFVSIFLPLLHFFLVPGFFLGGIGALFYFANVESEIKGGSGECPKCKAPFIIERSRNRWPVSDLCTKCMTQVRILRADTQE